VDWRFGSFERSDISIQTKNHLPRLDGAAESWQQRKLDLLVLEIPIEPRVIPRGLHETDGSRNASEKDLPSQLPNRRKHHYA
jgi:hypothetical protein